MKKINVAVIGAGGITGREVCRLLLSHEKVNKILPVARSQENFSRVHRNLDGSDLEFIKIEDLKKQLATVDVVYFCTPTGECMKNAKFFLDANCLIIDLSADFRFSSCDDFERAHNKKHMAPDLNSQAVYGITEIYRKKIVNSRLIANPGCYVIASILGMAPMLQSELIDFDKRISIFGINGTSGAGLSQKADLLHVNAFGSMLPYNLNGHRHCLEIEKQSEELSGCPVKCDLTTMHGNFSRGILVVICLPVKKLYIDTITRDSLISDYLDYFGKKSDKENFVIINNFSRNESASSKEYDLYPSMAKVVGSNFCHLGIDYDRNSEMIKIVSVIDNLIKGAAGSGIQNMNVALGYQENLGLEAYGM
ncbi:MAG: N-acetyl-gamma-glutamyl-phosphate reductase [Cellvibrionaceae bacterium]